MIDSRDQDRRKQADPTTNGQADAGGLCHSNPLPSEFEINKYRLPIKTVGEIIEEAGEEVPWLYEDIAARGALTDFAGVAKDSGKTTYWCHAIAAGARGGDHGGFATTPAKWLYLTEQGNNFANVLRDSGLENHQEYIRVVQFKDVSLVSWDKLIRSAGTDAKSLGLDGLIVDTFTVFAGLGGTEENDVGPVATRMRVLRAVAQQENLAVVLIRHAGKDGTPRGSSAFEAEADICITLGMPEGRHAITVRRLRGKGRYGLWERNIELKDGRYISLGSDNRIEFNRAVAFIKAVLPESPDVAMRRQELLDRSKGENITAATLKRALDWLVRQGDVGEKQLMHERGKPKVYWLAFKPRGTVSEEKRHGGVEPKSERKNGSEGRGYRSGDIHLGQTTTHTHRDETNKPEIGTPPNHPSPSPASDAVASQLALETVRPENNVCHNGTHATHERLTPEQVDEYKRLVAQGMTRAMAAATVRPSD